MEKRKKTRQVFVAKIPLAQALSWNLGEDEDGCPNSIIRSLKCRAAGILEDMGCDPSEINVDVELDDDMVSLAVTARLGA